MNGVRNMCTLWPLHSGKKHKTKYIFLNQANLYVFLCSGFGRSLLDSNAKEKHVGNRGHNSCFSLYIHLGCTVSDGVSHKRLLLLCSETEIKLL